MIEVIIDRFEGNYAICENSDKSFINIEKSKLPSNAKEGDVLLITDDNIKIDHDKTMKLKDDISKATEDLWE